MGKGPHSPFLLRRFPAPFQKLPGREDWTSHIGPKLQKVRISGYHTGRLHVKPYPLRRGRWHTSVPQSPAGRCPSINLTKSNRSPPSRPVLRRIGPTLFNAALFSTSLPADCLNRFLHVRGPGPGLLDVWTSPDEVDVPRA
jgi:hypothetical protein